MPEKQGILVHAKAKGAIVINTPRSEAMRQPVVAALGAFAFGKRGSERIPITRNVAADDLARSRRDDGERMCVAIGFRRVEKRQPWEMPQPRGDFRRREIDRDGLRGVIVNGNWHAPPFGQMRVLFK